MKNLFSSINLEGKGKALQLKESISIRMSQNFVFVNGDLSFNVEAYFDVVSFERGKLKRKYIEIEDLDLQYHNFKIGDIPIDSLRDFMKSLRESGLSTLSKSLEPNHKELEAICYKIVQNSKNIKKMYPDAILWNSLSVEEKDAIREEQKAMN